MLSSSSRSTTSLFSKYRHRREHAPRTIDTDVVVLAVSGPTHDLPGRLLSSHAVPELPWLAGPAAHCFSLQRVSVWKKSFRFRSAWNMGSARAFSGPRLRASSWAAKYLKFLPVPNAIQSSAFGCRPCAMDTATNTCTAFPNQLGWTKTEVGLYEPYRTTLPKESKTCDELVSCKCKNSCVKHCKCKRLHLNAQLCACVMENVYRIDILTSNKKCECDLRSQLYHFNTSDLFRAY